MHGGLHIGGGGQGLHTGGWHMEGLHMEVLEGASWGTRGTGVTGVQRYAWCTVSLRNGLSSNSDC